MGSNKSIFVNDLPLWILNNMILLFADNTKISCKISGDSDGLLLQQDLDSLLEWVKYWHLDFNTNLLFNRDGSTDRDRRSK